MDGDKQMDGHHQLLSVRAHLLEKTGDTAGAHEHHRRAAKSTASIAERRYLESRAGKVAAPAAGLKRPADADAAGPPPCGGDGRVAGAGREWAGACAHSFGFSSQIIPSLASLVVGQRRVALWRCQDLTVGTDSRVNGAHKRRSQRSRGHEHHAEACATGN
ncbi:hypothetical protein [Microtetraspora sp. AC03309]|uniref:hypothetical protein n=1 Tax=Microtetraspora sp. AC03309 TaxID=2779376 RepID=UPI001E440199|nr:hypothetical protein [Microtetraspora sp. AC03309]